MIPKVIWLMTKGHFITEVKAIYQYVFLPSHPPYPSRWVSMRKLCIWLGYQPLTLVDLNVYNMADFVEKITTDRYT